MKLSKILVSLLALVLCFSMCFGLVACKNNTDPDDIQQGDKDPVNPDDGDKDPVDENSLNETKTLIIQESTFDGVFNPFFYSNAYDGDVVGMVDVGLLTVDPTGAVVAGDEYATVGKSYSIFYTDDLTTFAPKDTYEDGDYVVYEVVLKNGCLFSDGSPVTAEDVLFNMYVYLDPAYVGSTTLYTIPILGLSDYRTQVAGSDVYAGLAAKIYAGGKEYTENSDYTAEQNEAYWIALDEAGVAFAQEICDYCVANYADDYAEEYVGASAADVKADPALQVKLGMAMWGFGDYWTEGATAEDYWAALVDAYDGDYATLSDTESAGMDLFAAAAENFTLAYAQAGSVPSISGLVEGTTTIDGVEYQTVKMILTEQNPKSLLQMGVTVAPKAYYTAGYEYSADAVVSYGVELGINGNSKFMDHLATLNSAPMGAGPYKFVSADGDGVTFVRNDNFYTMGNDNVYNAKVKNLYFKVIESGKEFDAMKAGDIDYATSMSASADVVAEIATIDNLTSILVDNLGYGYICINPAATAYGLDNVYTRIAYTSVLDLAQVLNYYPNGLADVIYRSQSQVSWAYPENAQAVYPFDDTLATAIENLKLAGYTYDEETGKFTDVPDIVFYLPSNSEDHPAGGILLKAQELLGTIGVTANIEVDTDLIANIKAGVTPVYALAWSAAQDPDMYQVYHYQSAAESVISNGIKWLQANGNDDAKGTIEVTKLDGTVVTMNQTQAIEYLAELIEEGVKYMSAEERKPIYEKALEVLAQLSIEIPTYQRKNMFAYDNTVIDGTSLSTTVTPYWNPTAEIWKLSFAE